MSPGLTLKYNKMDSTSDERRLFGLLGDIFSVAILEKPLNLELIDHTTNSTFMWLGRPYEQYCKENFSFLIRLLDSIKLGSGLRFNLKEHS